MSSLTAMSTALVAENMSYALSRATNLFKLLVNSTGMDLLYDCPNIRQVGNESNLMQFLILKNHLVEMNSGLSSANPSCILKVLNPAIDLLANLSALKHVFPGLVWVHLIVKTTGSCAQNAPIVVSRRLMISRLFLRPVPREQQLVGQ